MYTQACHPKQRQKLTLNVLSSSCLLGVLITGKIITLHCVAVNDQVKRGS